MHIARKEEPFNLLWWYSIISFICIVIISTITGFSLSRFLTNNTLQLDAVETKYFIQALVESEKASLYFSIEDKGQRGIKFSNIYKKFITNPEVTWVRAYDLEGTILWANDERFIGHNFMPNPELIQALSGSMAVSSGTSGKPLKGEHIFDKEVPYFAEIYLPVWSINRDKVVGVIEVYKIPHTLFSVINRGIRLVWITASLGGLFLYVSLYWIVKRATFVIHRQRVVLRDTNVVLEEKINDSERTAEALGSLLITTGVGSNKHFFHDCVQDLAKIYDVRYAFVGVFADDSHTAIRTVAIWAGDHIADNFSYNLAGTPSQDVLKLGMELVSTNVVQQYPKDVLLREMEVDSYFGAPLISSLKTTMGIVSVLGTKPMSLQDWAKPLLGIMANRLALELERQSTEDALKLAGTVFQSTTEAIMITDADEKIISVNPAFIKITGFSEGDVIGKTPRLFKSGKHNEAFYLEMWDLISDTGQWQGEIWDRKKDGTVYPKWLSIIAVKDKTGKIVQYIALFFDITRRKEMETQLLQIQKLETIGQLAGGVAHEFNNLLTPIIGYVDILLEQTLKQPKVQDPLFMVRNAAQRAAGLTKELLSFSRQTPMTLKPQSLSDLTLEAEHLLRQTIDRKIEIIIETSGDLWPVLIDADQIHQVVVNLCVNARDTLEECFLERSDFKPLIQIRLKNVHLDHKFCKSHPDAKVGDYVCLSIADNGSGIDETIVPHLFEPFFTTKEIGQGTGLGLASSHGIVKRHKGWIGLKTAKGEGTTFEVYLPRTGRPVVATVQKVTDQPDTHGPVAIMIVDDDESIRKLGKVVLEGTGHTILLAEGGDQALDIFKQERGRIEVVVLDLVMPRESGWEVLRRLRALDPALKVIISSGHDISDQTNEKGDLEPYTILSKPFSPSEMESAVREVLEQG